MFQQRCTRRTHPLPAVIRYRVEVHTADEPGADTEASLFIQLFGSGGDSGRRLLFHSLNHPDDALQAGQMDLFEVEAVTLETMQKIIIGHEETGKGGRTIDHKS